ncbi:MAG: hypothetical protein IKS96_12545 [Fibrobacter sp.]|nr:hypothetical protein [Fibrobacter sp.]
MRLVEVSLSLFMFFFAACGEEKEFMTPNPGEIVVDVNIEEYSLNGNVVGKTAADISNNGNLLIKRFDDELKKIRQNKFNESIKKGLPFEETKVKIHLNDNLTYDDFYKVFATIGFSGYTWIQYVIGSNFKEVYTLSLPERVSPDDWMNSCQSVRSVVALRMIKEKTSQLLNKNPGKVELTNDEIWEQRIKEKAILIECARKNIDLSLRVMNKGKMNSYSVDLNETGLTDGYKTHNFNTDVELWNFIEDIQSRLELRDKEDREKIVLAVNNDVLLKNITSIIKKLTTYGYKISFAKLGG